MVPSFPAVALEIAMPGVLRSDGSNDLPFICSLWRAAAGPGAGSALSRAGLEVDPSAGPDSSLSAVFPETKSREARGVARRVVSEAASSADKSRARVRALRSLFEVSS